jgi:cell division protein FtsL
VALLQEKLDGQVKKQAPVYFVSDVLSLSKKNFTELEKVLYVVLMASRKTSALFSSISHNCSFVTTFEGHYEEQRSYWKDWKMGCIT